VGGTDGVMREREGSNDREKLKDRESEKEREIAHG
jgi:hypothetical protein